MSAPRIRFDPLRLPPGTETLREEVRAFLAEEIARGAFDPALGHRNPGFDRGFSRRVGARGWIGMTWPRRYGGHERSFLERYVVTEEMWAASAPVWAHFVADRQSGPVILRYGPEWMKEEILPRICRGELCFAIGMSEPDSGSDLFAARSRAVREGDHFRVNGTKIWTSHAHRADYMIALFRTSPPTPENRRHGLSQFLVDMRLPGISVRSIEQLPGGSDFNEVRFDDVMIPARCLIGEPDAAWRQATAELAHERSGPERFLETFYVLAGLVRAIGPKASSAAGQASGHGEDHGRAVAVGIGRLVAELVALRRMSLSVAGMLEAGEDPVVEAAIVKDVGTQWEQGLPAAARDLLALLPPAPPGSAAAERREAFERVLDHATLIAPKLTIQGGTTEILRGIIARGLGLR